MTSRRTPRITAAPIRPGQLDRRITLRTPVFTPGPRGERVVTWQDLATVWAEVRPLPGTEVLTGAQATTLADTLFRIRWRTDVSPGMGVGFDGRDYEILAITEIGRRQGLVLFATARVL